MNERDASPIGFFQKYLTVWVILCMAVGICVGKFLPQIPEFLNRFEYARVSIPMAILIWVMIYCLWCLLAAQAATPHCRTCRNDWCIDRSACDVFPRKNRKQNERQVPRMTKPKVAFICVHNSCRSQIAEALGKALASDVFESYSAGTETKPRINQDAVRLMNALYGIDMEQTQYSKLISDIPEPDIAISMGCNVGCPFIGRPFDDNWGLEDPTGKDDAAFKDVIMQIHQNIIALKNRLQTI